MLEAGNGEEALRILEETAPEIVICDVLLPGRMNGFDITEHIKNDLSTSHIPVIMLTALNSQDQKILGLEKGADIYITKPFAFRELKAHIKSLIQLRESLKEKFRDYAFWAERELEISNNDETFIQRLIRIVETNMSDPAFDVNALSEAVNMSQTRLYRKLKSLTGMTIKEFIQGLRIRRAAALLLSREDKNISEIAYEIGFNDPNYFGKVFKSVYGMSPSEYIRKNSR
jgi:YesN/AraC family two-component response regulator